jgi:hypothetical protein
VVAPRERGLMWRWKLGQRRRNVVAKAAKAGGSNNEAATWWCCKKEEVVDSGVVLKCANDWRTWERHHIDATDFLSNQICLKIG